MGYDNLVSQFDRVPPLVTPKPQVPGAPGLPILETLDNQEFDS
jgi:hypothetical protein